MPDRLIRGVRLNYLTFGDSGPWTTFNPGSRRSMDELIPLARRLAGKGLRVLLHDRRTCGSSEAGFTGEGSEADVWADDLAERRQALGACPAYVGGSSSGARLAFTLAVRRPETVKGLLLWRLTGGREAASELVEHYYDQYARMARDGGMAAVCANEHFAALIRARPTNRDLIMSLDVDQFVAVMERWSADMLATADMPVIGVSEAQIRALTVPACLIPGNDRVHRPRYTFDLHAMMKGSELHELVRNFPDDELLDAFDMKEWEAQMPRMADIFASLIERAERATASGQP